MTTPRIGLPYIAQGQAQKEITHNEALMLLDIVSGGGVLDRDLNAPPGSPAPGDCYIVGPSPTGAWAEKAGHLAGWIEGVWWFVAPNPGMIVWVADEGQAVARGASAWVPLLDTITALQNLSLLGIGTTADATNPLAAKINKALFAARYTSEGGDGDLRYTMNKQSASNVLSILMQTDWSGRAQIGLVGDDNLLISSSQDGNIWHDAMRINQSGYVNFLKRPVFTAIGVKSPSSIPAIITWDNTVCNSGSHFNKTTGRFVAPVEGYYLFCASLLFNASSDASAIYILKNGGSIVGCQSYRSASSELDTISASISVYLQSGDYIEMIQYYNNLWYSTDISHFTGVLLG